MPFGRLWYGETNAVANAIGYAQHYSRSHDAVICVYDNAGNVMVPTLYYTTNTWTNVAPLIEGRHAAAR